jgi:uncharacterized protein YfiM (DUF2279 family)
VGVRKADRGRWEAWIWISELARTERITLFDDPVSAAIAHDRVALYVQGDRPRRLSFPTMSLRPASIQDIRSERRKERAAEREARTGTGFIGVHRLDSPTGVRWAVQIFLGAGPAVSIGTWSTKHAAAITYDRAALHYLGRAVNLPTAASRRGPATIEQLRAEALRAYKERTTSQYRGVHWSKSARKWRASIRVNGQAMDLGVHVEEEKAARVYDRAARKAWGSRAKLNFP